MLLVLNVTHLSLLLDFTSTIVSKGDWFRKRANIKGESKGVVVYVGSSLIVDNPLSQIVTE